MTTGTVQWTTVQWTTVQWTTVQWTTVRWTTVRWTTATVPMQQTTRITHTTTTHSTSISPPACGTTCRASCGSMPGSRTAHGASIQFGRGGRMVRLRPGRVTEMVLTFHEPGRYLVYCTMYCGPAHDVMQATIEVV